MGQLCEFSFRDLVCRNPCPQFDDLGQIVSSHLHFVQLLLGFFQTGIQTNQFALDLSQFFEVDLGFIFNGFFLGFQFFLFLCQLIISFDFRRTQIGACTTFVQQVNCLIRQEPVGNIPF